MDISVVGGNYEAADRDVVVAEPSAGEQGDEPGADQKALAVGLERCLQRRFRRRGIVIVLLRQRTLGFGPVVFRVG